MTHFNLFIYDRLADHPLLEGCEHVADATIGGALYDVGTSPVLLMYGTAPVRGRVLRCPAALLRMLDEAQRVGDGAYRRVGAEVTTDGGDTLPCWVYTAGPGMSRELLPDRCIGSTV